MGNSADLILNQNVFVGNYNTNGANFLVTAINSPTSITLEYLGYAGDLTAGNTIAAGSIIQSGTGNFLLPAAATTVVTTVPFNPAKGVPVTISVSSIVQFSVGQIIFIAGANYVITSIGALQLSLIPLNFPQDISSLSGTVASGTVVSQGTGNYSVGNAGASLVGGFAPAAQGAALTAQVTTSFPFQVGQNVVLNTGNGLINFLVTAIPDGTHVTLKTLTFTGDGTGMFAPVGSWLSPGTANITSFGIQQNNQGLGSAYTLTATPAAVTQGGGSASPTLKIAQAGTYLILASAQVDIIAARWSVSATHTVTLQLTDPSGPTQLGFPTLATFAALMAALVTGTLISGAMVPVVATLAAGHVVDLYASIEVAPDTSGSVQVTNATITAIRLY